MDPFNGTATCAWNIKITFDQGAYYNHALPLLTKCCEAICESHGQDFSLDTSMEVRAQGNPDKYITAASALTRTPWRLFPEEIINNLPREPNVVPIYINTACSLNRTSLIFRPYLLDAKEYHEWLSMVFKPAILNITVLSADKTVIHEDNIPITANLYNRTLPQYDESYNNESHFRSKIKIDAFTKKICNLGLKWSPGGDSIWLSPDFASPETFYSGWIGHHFYSLQSDVVFIMKYR